MGALILAVIWICGLGLMEIGDYIWTHYFKQTGREKVAQNFLHNFIQIA